MNRKPARKSGNDDTLAVNMIQKINRVLDIPQSAMLGGSRIELSGNREAVIDGCRGILEYDENAIRLDAGKMSVRFWGRGLQIKSLTSDSAVIEGFIGNIEFIC